MLNSSKWLHNINATVYRALSVLMLEKSAFCQKWAMRRRRRIRRHCHIHVEVFYEEKRYGGTIRNISASGALVEIQHDLKPGQEIILSFPLDYANSPIKTSATIVWTDIGVLGIRFIG